MVVAFAKELWQNIFEAGANRALVRAMNGAFACLFVILLALLVVTKSLHFLAMEVLTLGLWVAVNWFITEYNKFLKEKPSTEVSAGSGSSSGAGAEPAAASATTKQKRAKSAVKKRKV